MSARTVHEPLNEVDVQERKYLKPSEPIASTSNKYWLPVQYTFEASNKLYLFDVSCRTMTGWLCVGTAIS